MLYIYIITTSYHCVNTHYLIQIIFCIPFFKRKFKNTTNHTTYKFLVQIIIKTSIQIMTYLSIRGRYISTISCIASLSLILALHKTLQNHPKLSPSVSYFLIACNSCFSLFCVIFKIPPISSNDFYIYYTEH